MLGEHHDLIEALEIARTKFPSPWTGIELEFRWKPGQRAWQVRVSLPCRRGS